MAWKARTWQGARPGLVIIVIERVAGLLGAALGRQPGRAAFTGENPWQCRGFSLCTALVDRHRYDRHVVALLALVARVAVDIGEDRLDDVIDAAAGGADPAREPRQTVVVAAGVAGLEDAVRHHDQHVPGVQLDPRLAGFELRRDP